MMSPLLLCCLSLVCTLASSLPRLTITTHPAPLTSAPATLRCAAAADVLPSISWYKDGVLLSASPLDVGMGGGTSLGEAVSTLQLDCSDRVHVYTCVARAGDSRVSGARAVVLPGGDTCPGSQERVATWYSHVLVEQGAGVELVCDTRGPVTWTRAGEDTRLHAVTPRGGLVIPAVDWADMGTYTCDHTRPDGTRGAVDTFLYPLTPPVLGRK